MRHLLFGVYVVLCLAAVTWPVYAKLGSGVRPFVLGLPLSLVWVVGWVLLTFVALVLYHFSGQDERR